MPIPLPVIKGQTTVPAPWESISSHPYHNMACTSPVNCNIEFILPTCDRKRKVFCITYPKKDHMMTVVSRNPLKYTNLDDQSFYIE